MVIDFLIPSGQHWNHINADNSKWTEQPVYITTKEKEAMILIRNKKGYMARVGGKKKKEKVSELIF